MNLTYRNFVETPGLFFLAPCIEFLKFLLYNAFLPKLLRDPLQMTDDVAQISGDPLITEESLALSCKG